MFLSIENVTKEFGSFAAVRDFSIEIEKGELVSLLGPSGCGKTTMLRMIGGFLNPSKGRILLEDKDITAMTPEKRPVSTVFQSYALFPHMSVIENVEYGLKSNKAYSAKEVREKSVQMLSVVGLEELQKKNVTQISGGQQQRVALARSLILNPKVLLMDEPLSNLDAKLRVKMRKEIKQIQKRFGITMIFVTHDQEEAMSISDRIVVMNSGEIEQFGTPEQIYKAPETEFVADFIGRANILRLAGRKSVVRPQHIRLSSERGSYSGSIVEKTFLGFFTSYVIECEIEGERQLLQVDSMDSHGSHGVGERVYFEIERLHNLKD